MKMPRYINLPMVATGIDYLSALSRQLHRLLTDMSQQLNDISDGRIQASSALSSPPASGDFLLGDEVRNSVPQELGTAGNRYVVRGWICVSSGNPGTWREQRFLTGN